MITLPDNVRHDLVTLIPAALLSEITCFVFYDNHPRNKKCVDITVCTLRGEVKEFYKRDVINSIIIKSCWKPKDILIMRNNKCKLFYLVSYEDEIAILSSQDKLQVLHKISNIDRYEIDDFMCTGQANLKIIYKDDAVPLFFDNNFEKLGDRTEMYKENPDDCLPIVTQLARKLTEAQYSVKCNEKILKDLINLRQLAAYSNLIKSHSLPHEAVFIEDLVRTSSPLKIKSLTPCVQMCNKKITIILEVINKEQLLAENIHLLFHTFEISTVYTTKVFGSICSPPYWKENLSNTIADTELAAIVAVIDLKEVKYCVTSTINISGVLSYNVGTKEFILALNDVNLSSVETMGADFDVLSTIQDDENKLKILALLATSQKRELSLRHIKTGNEICKLLDEFCKHLNMEKIMDNIVLYRYSPYHVLYGVVVIEAKQLVEEDKWIVFLHTRSPDQILAFLHYLHDAIPYRIVASTINQKIVSKTPKFCKYDESTLTSECLKNIKCSEFISSMLKQTSMTLEYLDDCMMKMNESKNSTVQNKIGSEIHIFAGGVSSFQDFGNKLLEEALRGISSSKDP